MSLTQGPGRQHTSQWLGSSLHMGPSVPLRTESPTMTTLLSFLTEAVSRHGGDHLTLGSLLGRSSITSPLTSPSISSISNLLLRGSWGSRVGRQGGSHGTESGLFSSPPHLSDLSNWDRAGGPPLFWGFLPGNPSFWHASESLYKSVSCSRSLMVLSLSTPSLSSTIRLNSSSTC